MAYQKWNYRHHGIDFDDEASFGGRAYGYGYRHSVADMAKDLEPLVALLRSYDANRVELETAGGEIGDLKRLTETLHQEIAIQGQFREYRVSLTNQTGLNDMLGDVGGFNLHLAVRQLDTRLPVYYLCRLGHAYRSEYDLVLDDLYVSPGYLLADPRFVKLMRAGHEVYHLRLSPFRKKTEEIFSQNKVDVMLQEVGRHIFQAAWHEDQRLGVMVAQEFGLPQFHQAIEVLYLCLSGELCEIRNAVDEQMLRFFEEVYPQPAIRGFLQLLPRLEGGDLTNLTQTALGLFAQLSQAFKRFLSVPVEWGYRQDMLPLQKLIFGNFSRLARVAAPLAHHPKVSEAREVLEGEAREVVAALAGAPQTREDPQAGVGAR
jgi:hypothetical protein